MNMKKLSLIIPCFNEEEAIPIFYREARSVLDSLSHDPEMIFINDGSSDQSLKVLRELSEKDPAVRYLSFSRNFGKEAAMLAGLEASSGDLVAIMDVDLQDPPSLLPEMIEAIEVEGYDSAATKRSDRKGEKPVRSFLSRSFYSVINKVSDIEIVEGARDFRLMNRPMVNAILSMSENNRFSKGIFEWVGFKTKWFAYPNVERSAGETKWSTRKLFGYALNGIMNFSDVPLRLSSWMGIFMTVVSFIVLIGIVVRRLLFSDPVAGWASTICVIIFMGGLQMLCLGVLGQYVAKIYVEVKNRPHFFISEDSEHWNRSGCDREKRDD